MKTFFQVNKYILAVWMVYAVIQKLFTAFANVPPPLEKEFLDALVDAKYVMPSVIFIQGFLAISIFIKRYEFLALLLMAPITFNIVMLHVTLAPENIAKTIALLVLHLIAFYEYKPKVKSLFSK
jgi:putative oxidoreductase